MARFIPHTFPLMNLVKVCLAFIFNGLHDIEKLRIMNKGKSDLQCCPEYTGQMDEVKSRNEEALESWGESGIPWIQR